jgi:hypothetical protein
MYWIYWLIAVLFWMLFLYLTFMLAVRKGRSPFLWVILAIFLPLITVIILLVIPPKDRAAV